MRATRPSINKLHLTTLLPFSTMATMDGQAAALIAILKKPQATSEAKLAALNE
jgi:hypothetical protein